MWIPWRYTHAGSLRHWIPVRCYRYHPYNTLMNMGLTLSYIILMIHCVYLNRLVELCGKKLIMVDECIMDYEKRLRKT